MQMLWLFQGGVFSGRARELVSATPALGYEPISFHFYVRVSQTLNLGCLNGAWSAGRSSEYRLTTKVACLYAMAPDSSPVSLFYFIFILRVEVCNNANTGKAVCYS